MDAEDGVNAADSRPLSSQSASSRFETRSRYGLSINPRDSASPSSSRSREVSAALAPNRASARAMEAFDPDMWERVVEEVRTTAAIAEKSEESSLFINDVRQLDKVLDDASNSVRSGADTIQEEAIIDVLDNALRAASTSSSSMELSSAVNLINMVVTYASFPVQLLRQSIDFLSRTYYNATRAHKTKKTAEVTWTTLEHMLESDLGAQCASTLTAVVDCKDEAYLESKVGYSTVAGALKIISDNMLLSDPAGSTIPELELTQLLGGLWSTAVNGNDNLREFIMEVLCAILDSKHARRELSKQNGWEAVLETLDPCLTVSPDNKAARAVVERVIRRIENFPHTSLATIAQMTVDFDVSLSQLLSDELLASWQNSLSVRSTPNGFLGVMRQLGRSAQYAAQFEKLLDSAVAQVFSYPSSQDTFGSFLHIAQALAEDTVILDSSNALLANSIGSVFKRSLQRGNQALDSHALFALLCQMSSRSTEAATLLFRLRTDIEGVVYVKAIHRSTGESVVSTDTFDLDVDNDGPPLAFDTWHDAILVNLQRSSNFDVFHHCLTQLPSLLGNHTMFQNRLTFIRRLRSTVSELLDNGSYPDPPSSAALTKSDTIVALLQVLTSVLGYHTRLSKKDLLAMISVFLDTAGSRDYVVSIACVHALTICCYELPDLMSSWMDDVIDKMSKLVTQRNLAIHVLLFLAGLSRLPDLFRNFQTQDYKKIFGVCVGYLQSVRGTTMLADAHEAHSSDQSSAISAQSSDALPQYVYALAHHVIAFWYLALKAHDRGGLKGFIASNLKFTGADGQENLEDQGLVTIDLMDRVDVAETFVESAAPLRSADDKVTVVHRVAGTLLVTIETLSETGETLVTVRRPTATSRTVVSPSETSSLDSPESVVATADGTTNDCFPILSEDSAGRRYGVVFIPSKDSPLGAKAVLTLPNEDGVTRAIQSLDRTSALDSHKTGVIYIGEGQSTEEEILMNDTGAPDYREFYRSLGELVRLKDATFNTQGLDRVSDADGQHTIVWRNEVTELVFHITTLMTNNADVQMNTASKKRHIGNDHVNIVFNNSEAPFDSNTFPSQFNSVYIVITPSARTSFLQTRTLELTAAKDRFYTVQVLTRPDYPAISSAAEPKVVSGVSLPGYVRNLALNECVFSAMWAQKEDLSEYPSSWRSRLHQLRRLRERYGT